MSNINTTTYYVDENVVRIIAAEVILLTFSVVALYVWQPYGIFWKLPAILLTVDFALRAFTAMPSLLAIGAGKLVNLCKLKSKPIFAPPKRFAAGLGFIFSFLILISLLIELSIAAYVFAGVLLACALLESVFSICVGCYVFNFFFVAEFSDDETKIFD